MSQSVQMQNDILTYQLCNRDTSTSESEGASQWYQPMNGCISPPPTTESNTLPRRSRSSRSESRDNAAVPTASSSVSKSQHGSCFWLFVARSICKSMFSADVMVRSNEGDDALMSQSVVSVYQQRGRKSVVRNRKQPDIIYTPHAAYECNCIWSKIARNSCDIIF